MKSVLWWIFAIIFTIIIASYQKMTGPTYPIKGKVSLDQEVIGYKLIRTAENDKEAVISIPTKDSAIRGSIKYKRFKSNDEWVEKTMTFNNGKLEYPLPVLPAAGKMMYEVTLWKSVDTAGQSTKVLLADKGKPVVMRFKGPVPIYVLLPHILLMFLAMLFSTRAGIEALIKGPRTYLYSLLTLIFLIPGGLILGPIVQKFAFGAYWTGWPIGHDLTDNKTFVAFAFWLIAVLKLRKNRQATGWAVAAMIILLAVYLVPHSVMGSEIDFTQMPK